MSTKTQVTHVCDYDGKDIPNGEHHERVIGRDGQFRRLDLCMKHSDRLDTDTERWMRSGEAVRPLVTRHKRRTTVERRRSAEIRAWAKKQGIHLEDRGRIPAKVIDRYEREH